MSPPPHVGVHATTVAIAVMQGVVHVDPMLAVQPLWPHDETPCVTQERRVCLNLYAFVRVCACVQVGMCVLFHAGTWHMAYNHCA